MFHVFNCINFALYRVPLHKRNATNRFITLWLAAALNTKLAMLAAFKRCGSALSIFREPNSIKETALAVALSSWTSNIGEQSCRVQTAIHELRVQNTCMSWLECIELHTIRLGVLVPLSVSLRLYSTWFAAFIVGTLTVHPEENEEILSRRIPFERISFTNYKWKKNAETIFVLMQFASTVSPLTQMIFDCGDSEMRRKKKNGSAAAAAAYPLSKYEWHWKWACRDSIWQFYSSVVRLSHGSNNIIFQTKTLSQWDVEERRERLWMRRGIQFASRPAFGSSERTHNKENVKKEIPSLILEMNKTNVIIFLIHEDIPHMPFAAGHFSVVPCAHCTGM